MKYFCCWTLWYVLLLLPVEANIVLKYSDVWSWITHSGCIFNEVNKSKTGKYAFLNLHKLRNVFFFLEGLAETPLWRGGKRTWLRCIASGAVAGWNLRRNFLSLRCDRLTLSVHLIIERQIHQIWFEPTTSRRTLHHWGPKVPVLLPLRHRGAVNRR